MGVVHTLPNLKDKPYGGAWSIHAKEHLEYIKENAKPLSKPNVKNFLHNYADWSVQGHTLYGIEKYKHFAFSNGTTETFDKFYMQNINRRLRLWRGEYFYHQIVARENFYNKFAWIDEGPILDNDVVVVSLPFSDTGNIPEDFDKVMRLCCDRNVNVMIDMAYLNLSKPIEVNLDYNCIKVITTSLSKIFPVETYRIGIRMMKDYLDDTLQAYTDSAHPYINFNSIHIGQRLIENYSNNHIVTNYSKLQTEYCEALGVTPSNCTIFGIDTKSKYPEYRRGNKTSRLCFSRIWDGRINEK